MTDTADYEWRDHVPSLIPAALRLATRLCGDCQLGEDAVQESLIKLARYGSAFQSQSQLTTYFTRIVINVCSDLLARRRKQVETRLDDEVVIGPQRAQPEFVIAQQEQLMIIRQAVEKLPDRQRNVLVLSVWEQRTPAEIAQMLEITVHNVYSTLAAARKQLRQSLNEETVD